MLDDSARLKQTGHQTEISASIYQSTISEEIFGCSPDTVRKPGLKVAQFMRTVCRVGIAHIGGTSNQKLNLEVVLVYDFFSNF